MVVTGPGGVVVLVSQWLLISIAFAIICARLWLRIKIQRRALWASDYLMILAWLASVATAWSDIAFYRLGALEPHIDTFLTQYDGRPEDVVYILKLFWASSFPFYSTFYLCKAALLATFLQLFPRFMKRRRIGLWVAIGYTVTCYVISIVYQLAGCRPVERNWSLGNDACPNEFAGTSFRLAWALHFSSDIVIFALPFTILHELQLKRTVKAGVYCTFLLSVINLTFCVIRFATVNSADSDNAVPLSLVDLWSSLDCNITLLIACLPSLRPYLHSHKTIMQPSDAYGGKYVTNSAKKSVPRASQRGFEPLDEERSVAALSGAVGSIAGTGSVPGGGPATGVMRTTTIHVQRGPSNLSPGPDESWLQDEREKSDIELVRVKKAGKGESL